jgi:hypothetical protein
VTVEPTPPVVAYPTCGDTENRFRPRSPWWGGAIGPTLLRHTVCEICGTGFNASTGKPNEKAVQRMALVPVAIFIVLTVGLIVASTL